MKTRSTDAVDDGYYSVRALAAYSGLSIRTLRTHLTHRLHPLPHYRIGGKIVVRRSEFDAWTAQFRVVRESNLEGLIDDVLAGLR